MTEADVVVERNAAILAAQHLVEQGRGQGKSAGNIADKVQRLVLQTWGTSKVPRFEDEDSGGWLIDVSSAFDNEAMYAVVRTKNGTRTVTEIIEEERAFKIMRPSEPPPPPEPEPDFSDGKIKLTGGDESYPPIHIDVDDDDDENELFGAQSDLREQLFMLKKENERQDDEIHALRRMVDKLKLKGDDRVLIRWHHKKFKSLDGSEEQKPAFDEKHLKYHEVSAKVQELLADGVSAGNIEIWTGLKRPQVKVELV